jgi:hypothetical protein
MAVRVLDKSGGIHLDNEKQLNEFSWREINAN